ncbi:MAG: hemerythrin domain-containing protein [Planctomycetaceae bacterium]|nr:hemerythrin domain-containing protein [Planctomycetaceae bacterium]
MASTELQELQHVCQRAHAGLHEEIHEWREWWKQLCELGQPNFGEMAARLAHFRQHLREHFTEMERSGCATGFAIAEPQLASEICMLQGEHPELLAELDAIIEELQSLQPGVCWGEARQRVEGFLDQLHEHELAEERLIQSFS